MLKLESPLVKEANRVFFTDVHDHLVKGIDVIESLREVLAGLQDLHISITGHHMNEIMKVLTIIATIFIPITFVAGIYGMNFEVMPELKWRWGYFAVIIVAMLVHFRRRKWF